MYRALYRKYRPSLFSDVIGQPGIVKALKNQIALDKAGHAYMFTGVRGTGKTSCARILAKALNCLDPKEGEPCGSCANCADIAQGNATDICEIDAASNNGVDYIRELREEVVFAPAKLKYRIYIIDEVHMLSGAAFNALLKTLEEPPAHVKFILATTEIHKVPVTILSRCQRYDFARISAAEIAELITSICEKEGITIEPAAALLIAGAADGGMRDAISLLELCHFEEGNITSASASASLGIISDDYLTEMAEAVKAGDYAKANAVYETVYEKGLDPERLCVRLMEHYRTGLLEIMAKPSARENKSFAAYKNHLDILRDCYENLPKSSFRKLDMQLALYYMCEGYGEVKTLEQRLSALEEKLASAVLHPAAQPQPVQPAPSRAQTYAPAPKTYAPVASADSTPPQTASAVPHVAGIDRWDEILELICSSDPQLRPVLTGCSAVGDGNRLVLYSPNPFFTDIMKADENRAKLRKAINEILGEDNPFNRLSVVDEPVQPPKTQAPPADKSADELVEKAKLAGVETIVKE